VKLGKENLKKILIVIGIVIFITGLFIHTSIPIEIGNSMDSNQENGGEREVENIKNNYIIHIKPELDSSDSPLNMNIFVSLSSIGNLNCTILILNKTNLIKFENGTSIKDLDLIEKYESNNDNEDVFKEDIIIKGEKDIYIVLINHSRILLDISYFYYYSIIPPTYYLGLIIMAIGLIFIALTLIWYFKGWKKAFVIGASVNIGAFLIGIATLSKFFIMPELFSNIFQIELYGDFKFYYIEWIYEFRNGNWPYSNYYFGYIYGPLFILTLGIFSYLPLPIWSAALPFLICTLGTGYLVYLITYKLTENENYAIISMLLFFTNPFTLIYSSYLWINPPLFVFFVLLSFYLALNENFSLSIISLGIATMFKQFAIIFFPLILLLILKQIPNSNVKEKVKKMVYFSAIFGLVILLISLPFLFIDAESYLNEIFFFHTQYSVDFLTIFHNSLSYPVNFNSFFLLLGTHWIITRIIAYLLAFYILLGLSMLIIFLYFAGYPAKNLNKNHSINENLIIIALFYSIFLVICVQIFFPRGSYKFYLILLTPFISIFFHSKNLTLSKEFDRDEYKFNKRYLIPLIFSWIIFFSYRYIYFWILLIWMFYYIHYMPKLEIKISNNNS